jgi:hypothetical protein
MKHVESPVHPLFFLNREPRAKAHMARRNRYRSLHFRSGSSGLSIKSCGFFCDFDRRILKPFQERHGNPADTGNTAGIVQASPRQLRMSAMPAAHGKSGIAMDAMG